jgi:hypothetical protein
MVSAKLVHQIELHWEAISGRFLRQLRASHHVPHISRIPESDILEVCRRVLHNLGHWLVSTSEEEIAHLYEHMGQERYRQGVPLSEALRTIQLMKDATLDYVRDEGPIQNSIDLYAEEELEHQLGRFFDLMMYYLTRGYEEACKAMQTHA